MNCKVCGAKSESEYCFRHKPRKPAARVSDKHCNFLINTGGATALDIETLGETVRRQVQENGGPELRWEIRRIGRDLKASKNQEGAE